MRDNPKTKLAVYLAVTFGMSGVFYGIIIASGFGSLSVLGLMWCPAAGAIAARLLTQGNLRGMGWGLSPAGRGGIRYFAAAFALPVVAGLAVYGLVWISGLGGFDPQPFSGYPRGVSGWIPALSRALLRQLTVGMALSVLSAFGEELGWRGLMMPELAKMTDYRRVVLWGSLIWAVYHYPLILFSGYHSNAPLWYGTVMFTLSVSAISFVFAWLRLKSGSLWTGVLLHATHNLVIQGIFDRMTSDRGATVYLTGEFGIGLVVAYGVVALWCWRKRDLLPAPGSRV